MKKEPVVQRSEGGPSSQRQQPMQRPCGRRERGVLPERRPVWLKRREGGSSGRDEVAEVGTRRVQ